MSHPSINASSGKMNRGSVDSFNSNDHVKGDLLLGFPHRQSAASSSHQTMLGASASTAGIPPSALSSSSGSGKAKQRNSISINPLAMRGALAGLSDLDDSEDEDEKQNQKKAPPPPPPLAPSNPNPKASGGPDHRPLVGGFAAAAYEAARVDYYKKQGKDVRGHHAPKPRPHYHYPRYP